MGSTSIFNIFFIAMKFLWIYTLNSPAVSRGNRVDHNHIRHIQDGVFIIYKAVRSRRGNSFIVQQEPLLDRELQYEAS